MRIAVKSREIRGAQEGGERNASLLFYFKLSFIDNTTVIFCSGSWRVAEARYKIEKSTHNLFKKSIS